MAVVTCHTQNCAKEGQPVPGVPTTWEDENGQAQPVGSIICGACGQEITDIQEESEPRS